MIISSNLPIQKTEAVTYFLLGLASTLIPAVLFSAWDGTIVVLMLFVVFRLFFKRYDRLLFTFSYGLYLLNATFFLLILNFVNGSPFLAGGDDVFFYNAGRELFLAGYDINTEIDGVPLWLANYPFYLYLISFYYGLLSFVGLDSLHFYHLTLFKVALGAVIPVLIYKLGNLNQKEISRTDLFMIILFPAFMLQTVSFLRDSVISLFFVFGVYKVVSNTKVISKFLWVLPVAGLIYFIRPVHAFFLLLFFATYVIYLNKNFFWLKLIGSSIFFFMSFVVLKLKFGDLFAEYERVQGMYMELSAETNQEGSLGVKLYSSTFPLLWPVKLLYYYMSPIPPPIVGRLNLMTIYISMGALFWYLIVFGFLKSLLRRFNSINPFYLSLFILFIAAGIVGVSTSKDPRHLTFIYPLIIPFGLRELRIMPRMQLYLIFLTLGLAALVGYIMLKVLV